MKKNISEKYIPVAVLEIVGFQGHLADGVKRDGSFICTKFLEHIKKFDTHKSITYVDVFDGASNVQCDGEIFKIHYPKVSVMRGVEHTVLLFFNDVSKIPVVNKIIIDHKEIYKLFGSGVYHKPHSILKSKSYEFQKRNIGLFRGNDNRMAGYFIGMHRDICMIKAPLVTFSST